MNNNNDQQIQDPSTQGVGGLKGLKGLGQENKEPTIFDLAKDYNKTIRQINRTAPITKEIGFAGVGDSIYDKEISTTSQLEDLEDTRAKLQSNFMKVTNGLAKGAVLAGTTFLDGTVGLVFGGLQAMEEGRWSALWDNDFSRAMKVTSEWSERAMPNYYTKEEREEPWYDHIFTANFLGDKFIKNLGFSVGAIYSGGVWTKALQATRLPQLIGLVAQSSNAPRVVSAVTGSVMAAVNEGRVEALNNATEWGNTQVAKLNDWHQAQLMTIAAEHGNTDYYEDLVAEENKRYEETLAKISEDKLKMGNADLLMNIILLTATNMFEFGKFFARGAQTARRTSNIVRNAEGLYIAEKPNWVLKGTGNVISEGVVEEGGQGLENRVAGKYYEIDVNNFYASKLDPQAEQQTLSWMRAFADGINETVNDSSAWEEMLIGGLTGALGIPRFRSVHKTDGGFQSPIAIEGGFLGERREANEAQKRDQEIVDYLNNRMQSPEFLNYYQGLIRHNKYQNDMNAAAEAGDTFEFKNAEHSQLLSDIAMFSNAGRLDDLTTMIESAYDLSDENLDSIIKNTTSTITSESGEELRVGPFVDSKGNPMSREEMRKKLTETRDEILNTAQEYSKTRESLDIKTNGILSEDELENLTWLKMHSADWQRRGSELFEEIKPILGRISGRLSQLADIDHYIKAEEGKRNTGLSELYEIADAQERNLNNARNLITFIRNLDSKSFGRLKPEIIKSIEDLANDENVGLPADEVQEFNEKIDDLVKAQKAADKFNVKLVEYITNPNKVKEDAQATTERVAKEDLDNKSTNLRDKLNAATSLSDFRQILDTEEDSDIKQKVLKELEESGNLIAQNYKETSTYDKEVRRNLDQLNVTPEVREAALKLYGNQYKASNTLEELANPDSVRISDENAIYNDSLTEEENNKLFNEAQYALTEAMRKVNNDNAFKDRFSREYKEPKSKAKSTPKTQATQGANTASTTQTTQQRATSPYEAPVGDVSAEQISTENAEANSRVETTQSLDNKQSGRRPYYRPSIPELHIEASKEGDFRPFNVVANEKNPRVNFDDLYNYLKDHGAFDYVNAANLRVGDELGFMIDPEFNDHTIFIVDKKNNQIVGSLDESEYSVDRYEGLKELEEDIRKEFSENADKSKKFIATPTTRVSQIMVGRIPYGNTERSLANIPNVSGEGKSPIFGIVKNGTLSTNGKVDDSLVTKPVNMAQKEGRMYLLIPNAAGKYSPAAVRVKHFNRSEFNPQDVEVQNTPAYKNIQEAIDALADSSSEEDVNNAVKTLAQHLYTGNLHIDWFSSETGNGIRFTQVQRDAQGNEIYEERNGQRLRKENVHTVFISKGVAADPNYVGSLGVEAGDSLIDTRDINDIKRDITNILLGMNLPIQVNLGMLNRGGYNNMLVNSGVLTSNISDARVLSSWFTTDYFDSEGNLHRATNPATVVPGTQRTPVGGAEGAIPGTKITSTLSGKNYYIDLSSNTIRDAQGQTVPITDKNKILLDLAWAQENFGDATTGSMMWDNKVITPNGKVLDRTAQKYLGYEESLRVKDIITGRAIPEDTRGTKKVIGQIAENQKRVDKTRTDGEFYYILEDDGQYHEYDRVHKRLGSNWVESKKQADALKDISVKLSQLSDNTAQYNNYLTNLGNHFGVDLSSFSGKVDVRDRDTIVNLIRDKMSGTNSQRALEAGTAVDSVIRNFFTSNETPVRPSNMSETAFSNLINALTEVKSNIEARGEKFLTNNIVLFQKYADGTRIAGEVDILSVDSNGNFRIYDVKTSRYSFHNFTDRFGHQVNYFKNKSATQRMSTEAYYTQQLSAYKNLFESQYHTPVTSLGIIPFVLNYEGDNISNITREKGIAITYDPAVNVPLVGAVKTTKKTPTSSSLPLFNSSLETQNPINKVLPENAFEQGGIVGYYERDGKLYSGYLKHIGTIDNVDIYLTKERDRGFGRPGELNKSSNYYVVLPNGKFVDTKTLSESDNVAADVIMKALQAKPEKVKALASEETTLSKSVITTPIVETPREATPATILSTPTVSGAARAAQAEQAINQLDSEFEDELDLGRLRKVDEEKYTKWDKEKETAWLNKVLPQMSTEDRFRVINGVIKIAESGAEAWGQFNNGIITLSDEAAEGTVYHEAFHAVFNLLLDPEERLPLFEEARKLYGEKDELSLEEDMAEAFREYVMTREKANLGQRILNFFKDLYIKVTNWEKLQPSLTSLYQQINEGKYASQGLYTPEMHNILAEAKRDSEGHLLAPNGKPTNLNERQYAQVRTRAFKNWFGNWINPYSSNISISLDIDRESIDADGFGSMVNIRLGEEEIGTIPVQQQIKSIKDFKFTKYVDINGIAGASEIYEEYRGKGYGKASYWELGMWLSRNGSILRSARDDSRTEAATRVWRSLERDGFARKVDNRYEFVDNSSKVVDENGEPLVVYHESPNKFNTFDTSRKRFNVHDVKGIWTTPVNREGWGYGDNIYPLFVNLRNPNYTHTQGTQTFGEMRRVENKALNDPNSDGAILETFDKFGPETQIYVKNANQVKSATDNMGDFSIVNNDIRYRKIQDSLFESLSNEVVEDLLKKGWTQEKFNSVSQREREQALKCLPL